MSIVALIAIYAGLLIAAFAIAATVKAYQRKARTMVTADIDAARLNRVLYHNGEAFKAYRALR